MTPITPKEASSELGCSVHTIYKAAEAGRLTKIPTVDNKMKLIKEQVMLFKGITQIRESSLSKDKKELWKKYKEAVEKAQERDQNISLHNSYDNADKPNRVVSRTEIDPITGKETRTVVVLQDYSEEELNNAMRTLNVLKNVDRLSSTTPEGISEKNKSPRNDEELKIYIERLSKKILKNTSDELFNEEAFNRVIDYLVSLHEEGQGIPVFADSFLALLPYIKTVALKCSAS